MPRGMLIVLGLLVTAACGTSPQPPEGAGPEPGPDVPTLENEPPPGPTLAQLPANCTGALEALALVNTMEFSTSRSDTTTLPAFRGAGTAEVRIEPAVGNHLLTDADLADGQIIARMTASEAWGAMGLPAGDAYWWVRYDRNPSQAYIPAGGGSFECQPLEADLMEETYGEAIGYFAAGTVPWSNCAHRCCCGIFADGCLHLVHRTWAEIQADSLLAPVDLDSTYTLEQIFARSGA